MAFGLLPHTQTAMIAGHDVAYHDYEGIATDLDERERLVADIGTRSGRPAAWASGESSASSG